MEIKIIVATHKKYWMPEDTIYLPLHVGKQGKEEIGYLGDETGKNISFKNKDYCELTGMYWAWKNLQCDYIGLVHYRRHFIREKHFFWQNKKSLVLGKAELAELLKKNDIIVPKQRRYYIETIYSQYAHAHDKRALDEVEKIIMEKYPEYNEAFERLRQRTWAHMFNMCIMKRIYFDAYCDWLFDVLFSLEARLADYEPRVFGFMSERLFDVWLEANQITYKEVPVMFMEQQNWLKKGMQFLKRKITNI